MASPFVAEIRIFACNFAPRGWAMCNGQLLPISQNTALFSLLGTQYGGDGKSTFALPNFQGNVPMQHGQGPGLSQRFIGETSGVETVTLLQTEMPQHNHTLLAANTSATTPNPSGAVLARGNYDDGTNLGPAATYIAAASANPKTQMSPLSAGVIGGNQPHNNMAPYLTLNFCIALQGVFPARN